MENLNKRSLYKNIDSLIILFIGGALIYILPYLKNYYYDSFKLAMNINDEQMGNLGMYYGIAAFVSYFLGGFLADKFSARKLLGVSFFITSAGGFYLSTFPSYQMLCLIHATWGITTILTFWPALIKAIRALADEDEQGKAFGFFDGGRGLVNSVVMTLAALIINKYGWSNTNLKYMVLFYSTMLLIVGCALLLTLKDNPLEKTSEKFSFQSFFHVVKMPHTWLIIIIVFCSYSTNMVSYYITPFSTNILGKSALLSIVLTIAAQYLRPFSAPLAGIFGDRMNSSKVVCFGFLLMAASHLILVLMPNSGTALLTIIISACLLMYTSMFGIQALHYALMEETEYPLHLSGVAVGVIATFGYLPESIIPKISGMYLQHFQENIALGYKYVFGTAAILAIIGFLTTLYWMHVTKEKRAYLLNVKKQKHNLKQEN